MTRTHRSLALIILAALWKEAIGLTCPPSYRPNGSTRCVYVVNNQTASATAAAAACGPNPLVDVQDLVQYTNLKLYLQVQGTPLASYWTQYNYNAGVLTPSSAIVGNPSNFNGSSSGSTGQCVAIQQQGLFVLTSCSNSLPFICVSNTQALTTPTVSISATPTSPVAGTAVTLTCSYSNSTSVSLQKDDVSITTSTVPLNASSSLLNLTLASIPAGRYDCVAGNPLGAVKSNAIVIPAGGATTIAPITLTLNGTTTNSPVTLPLGTIFNITCSTSSSVSWTWFRNGAPLSSSSPSSLSSITVNDFTTYDTSGFYQCRALDPSSNSNIIAQILVLATDGVPGPVDSVFVSPSSQTAIVVNWVPPSNPNTDQSLLRYTITWCNSTSPLCITSPGVAPVASLDPTFAITTPFPGQMTISQLQPGSQYTVQVGVASPAGGVVAPLYNATIATFGTVPNDTVQIYNVSRTQDNTTIVAYWQPLVTTPPVGQIVRYYVEYRDATKGTSNTVYVSSSYTYIVLQNLMNANNYEIRVQAAVQTSSNPNTFGFTTPTNWTFSSGIAPFTTGTGPNGGVGTPVDSSVVAPAVIVPVFVVATVVVVAIVAIIIWLKRKSSVYHTSKPSDATDGAYDIKLMPADNEGD